MEIAKQINKNGIKRFETFLTVLCSISANERVVFIVSTKITS